MLTNTTRLAAALTASAFLLAAGPALAGDAPGERTITMQAIQLDMTRHVDRTPFPAHTLEQYPDLEAGGGYALTPPNDKGEWRARAYAWHPGIVVVNQGEKVTLEMFGIHGDEHPGYLEGYDIAFVARRGEITRVSFVADKPGIFQIRCAPHLPTMTAQIVVLPAS